VHFGLVWEAAFFWTTGLRPGRAGGAARAAGGRVGWAGGRANGSFVLANLGFYLDGDSTMQSQGFEVFRKA
jgi:hypothetical protein